MEIAREVGGEGRGRGGRGGGGGREGERGWERDSVCVRTIYLCLCEREAWIHICVCRGAIYDKREEGSFMEDMDRDG
jgi:hypothetical protein